MTIPERVPILGADPRVSFSGQQSEKYSVNPIKLSIVRGLRSGALQISVVQESAIDRLAVYGIDYTDMSFLYYPKSVRRKRACGEMQRYKKRRRLNC